MTREEIKQSVKELAQNVLGTELSEEENLAESGVDSLSLVVLIAEIENEFHICFGADDLQPKELKTLADLVRITEKLS